MAALLAGSPGGGVKTVPLSDKNGTVYPRVDLTPDFGRCVVARRGEGQPAAEVFLETIQARGGFRSLADDLFAICYQLKTVISQETRRQKSCSSVGDAFEPRNVLA